MTRPARHADVEYFSARAEQEIARAQSAEHPAAVQAHYELAGHYLELVYGGPDAPSRPLNRWQH